LQSGIAPPVALDTTFWNEHVIFGAAEGSATTSAAASTVRPTMTASQLMVAWPRSEANRDLMSSAARIVVRYVRRARHPCARPPQRRTSRDRRTV